MIWLRSRLEHTRRRRWLWPLVAILFVLFLVMVAVHGVADDASTSSYICVGLVLLAFVAIVIPRLKTPLPAHLPVGRAPPSVQVVVRRFTAVLFSLTPLPLRL